MNENNLQEKNDKTELQRFKLDYLAKTKKQAIELIRETNFFKDYASSTMLITDEILKPLDCFRNQKKTALDLWDLVNGYELFIELCKEINKKRVFSPTVNTFCHFMGLTNKRFSVMLREENERGEFCRYVKDHISEIFMQNMLTEKIPQIPSIFIAKANLDMHENDPSVANQIIINNEHKSFEQIIKDYQED